MTNRERCIDFVARHPTIATIVVSREVGEELTDIYYRLTGKIVSCSGCSSEALMAHNSILKFIERDSNPDHIFNKNKIMSNYKLKKDVLAYSQTDNRHYNNDSLTDESAVAIIAENENNLELFDEYPSDYLKDVSAFNEKQKELKMEMEKEVVEEKSEVIKEEIKFVEDKEVEVKEKSKFPKRK